MKKTKEYIINEWVTPSAFPFIIPLVERFEQGEINLQEAYSELEKEIFIPEKMYEKFNLAHFLRNGKFPDNMKNIKRQPKQGDPFYGGTCLYSTGLYTNALVLMDSGEFCIVFVTEDLLNNPP